MSTIQGLKYKKKFGFEFSCQNNIAIISPNILIFSSKLMHVVHLSDFQTLCPKTKVFFKVVQCSRRWLGLLPLKDF